MANRFKNLRNTPAGWAADDKVIGQGEIALTVTSMPAGEVTAMRIGDGVSTHSQLPAFADGGVGSFVTLTDATSANLLINAPLANALNSLVPGTRVVNGKPLNADVVLTKGDLGLSLVDNVADASKPVSTAQLAAINAKVANDLTASTTIAPSKTAVAAALATKADTTYVDSLIQGVKWKALPVIAATTAAGTLASSFENGDTVDGRVLVTGDRVLIKNQASAAENGIYTVNASGSPTRATDSDTEVELVNAAVFVLNGSVNGGAAFVCTSVAPITINVSAINWGQISSVNVADNSVTTSKLADSAVTPAKLATVTSKSYLGRTSSGSGAVEVLTASQLATDLLPYIPSGAVTLVTHSDSIPLDTVGFGKKANATVSLTANRSLTVAASPVDGASYEVTFQQDATGGRTITPPAGASQLGTDVMATTAGSRARWVFLYIDGDVKYSIIPLAGLDVTAPTYGARTISEASPTKIVVTMSEPIVTNGLATGDVTTTNAGGRTLSSVAIVGSTIELTYNTAFTYDVVPSVAIASGKVKDVANNLAGALSTSVVTNNRTLPVPGSPSIALGTATANTQPITITAPTVDSTHGAATLYQVQYRLAGVGSYTDFGAPSSTLTPTVTGLAAATNYDYRAYSLNATGTGGISSVATGLTASAPGSAFINPSVLHDNGDLAAANVADLNTVNTDWIVCRGNSNTPVRKGTGAFSGVDIGLLTGPVDTNINSATRGNLDPNDDAYLPNLVWPWTASEGSGGSRSNASYSPTTNGVAMQRDFTAPAIAGQQNTILIDFCNRRYEYGTTSSLLGVRFVITMSDGSVSPVTYDVSGTVGDYGYHGAQVKIDYKPNTTGTITVSCRELPSATAFHGIAGYSWAVHGAQYRANT